MTHDSDPSVGNRLECRAALLLRLALAAGFLSAVADRFGIWGQPGEAGVAWGNFDNFVVYTGTLNPFVPGVLVNALALVATALEIGLACALLSGRAQRPVALASAGLLSLFALAMVVALGVKAPLDYSVFSAAAGALALAALTPRSGPKLA